MLIIRLLLILEVYNAKPTHMKSWARNLLILDLTLGPSFKVKRWFIGFGELSFRWIQICIGSPMRRSSFIYSTNLLLHLRRIKMYLKTQTLFVTLLQKYSSLSLNLWLVCSTLCEVHSYIGTMDLALHVSWLSSDLNEYHWFSALTLQGMNCC